jgi:enterochelin esterase-like enzyme
MPEPQSTAFFLMLLVVFAALIWWLAVAKQLVFRILAACLAFIPAMMFGVAAVNKYYDYYQNWNAAIADFTNQPVGQDAPELPGRTGDVGVRFGKFMGEPFDPSLAAMEGFTVRLTVHGRLSNITRTVYVYLPPQYFQSAYKNYKFPAIELIHGFPGEPQDWITVMGVNTIFVNLLNEHRAKPAVLVMPSANGGMKISLQCLNQFRGPQDATYLAEDLPTRIAQLFRVQQPGLGWAIAGYSEGGFCAANLGIKYGSRFAYAGVMSGYFKPFDNQLGNPPRLVSPFGGSQKLRRANTPLDLLESLPPGSPVPEFWLGAGAADSVDVKNAEIFEQLVRLRQPGVTLRLVPGGGHTMFTWRALMPPMLEWMTPGLATNAARVDRIAARHAQKQLEKSKQAARKRAAELKRDRQKRKKGRSGKTK